MMSMIAPPTAIDAFAAAAVAGIGSDQDNIFGCEIRLVGVHRTFPLYLLPEPVDERRLSVRKAG
jgi:hypothetical protein